MGALLGLIFEFVVEYLLCAFLAVVLIGTGEILRFVFSLGRHTPRLRESPPGRRDLPSPLLHPSLWLGVVFWCAVLGACLVWIVR